MKTLGLHHRVVSPDAVPLPGVAGRDRQHINDEARALLRDAVDGRRRLQGVCLRIAVDGAFLEDREQLASLYVRHGVRTLARRLRVALVPQGHALVLIDVEGETGLRVVALRDLGVDAEPAATVLAQRGAP